MKIPTGTLRPEQVHLKQGSVQRLEGARPNLGSSSSAFWVQVSGWQGAPRNARVVLDNPTLDSIDVFVIEWFKGAGFSALWCGLWQG